MFGLSTFPTAVLLAFGLLFHAASSSANEEKANDSIAVADAALKNLVEILAGMEEKGVPGVVLPFKDGCVRYGKFCMSRQFGAQNGHAKIMLDSHRSFNVNDGYCFVIQLQGRFDSMNQSAGIHASGAEQIGVPDGDWWLGAGSKNGGDAVVSARCIFWNWPKSDDGESG